MAKTTGLLLGGSLKTAGVTFYQRKGQMVARAARSKERRSNTRGQFVQRQRMRHTTALWRQLKPCQPVLAGGKSVYARFATLANSLPVVFVPNNGPLCGASFLMPGIPVSDGTLPTVKQHLGEVGGVPALITNLRPSSLHAGERLVLYTAVQEAGSGTPRVFFDAVREIKPEDCVKTDGCLALTGEEFADEMKGWALVRTGADGQDGMRRCSTQVLVTRCRHYEQYTTEEALLLAAKSYGGLTDSQR